MILPLLAVVLASPTLPKACEPPAARDVKALAELAKKSGSVSVGLDSVATWCFESSGAWTGGHKLKKGQAPDPEAIPSGDCAKAIGSCEGAKLVLTDDLRQLLADTLTDIDTPYLGVKYTPKRSGLSERPPDVADCRSKNRSELFAQAQARMDIARLANQAQSEYRNFRTWLYKESLTCAQMVARGETDLTRRGIAIDSPVQKGGGTLQVDAGVAAGAVVTQDVGTKSPSATAGTGGAQVQGSTGTGASGTSGKGTVGSGATVAGAAGTGAASAGTTGTGAASAGTTGAGVVGTGVTGTGVAGAGVTGTGVAGTGAAGTGVAGTGAAGTGAGAASGGAAGTGAAGTSAAGAGAAGTGVAGTGVAGAGAAGTGAAGTGTGAAGTGVAGTGVAGTGAAGAGGTGVTSKSVPGTSSATGTSGAGTTTTGAAAGGTGSIGAAVAASPGVGAAVASVTKDLPLGGPTLERQRALASSMIVKWRYLAEQRARLEPDPDWVSGFLVSRELRDCRCQRVEPKAIVARLESGDGVAALQADDDKNTRCELCLQDAWAPWKARVQKQCAQMDDFTDYELGVLQRSADGSGLPPRCFDASRARRAAKASAKPATAQTGTTAAKGGSAFIITKNPDAPAPVAQGGGSEKPTDYAPVPPREEGRLYYRVFMSRACEAEVEPGPITARTGDLMPVPPGAAALIVKSPCGGLVEVYFGKEEKPRVTEVFAKNQPLRLQFRKP